MHHHTQFVKIVKKNLQSEKVHPTVGAFLNLMGHAASQTSPRSRHTLFRLSHEIWHGTEVYSGLKGEISFGVLKYKASILRRSKVDEIQDL